MRMKFAPAGFLIFSLLFGLPVVAGNFGFVTAAQAAVNGVVIQGSQRVDRETILSYLQFKPSQAASAQQIDASIKALFETGLFSDVKIDRQGGNIVIKVVENPMINVVNFEGNDEIDDSTL